MKTTHSPENPAKRLSRQLAPYSNVVLLENESATLDLGGLVELADLVNDIAVDGKMLIPLGDHPHELGIQRLDAEAAQRIVKTFNSILRKSPLNRVQIYVGHPDSPTHGHKYPDKNPHGYIKAVALENHAIDGEEEKPYLALTPRYGKQAREFLENLNYQAFSPSFGGEAIGKENGKTVYRPVVLFSVGLTNQPNIPVVPIANDKTGEEHTTSTKENTMWKWLAGLLGLSNDATEEEVQKKVKEQLDNSAAQHAADQARIKELENELQTEKSALENEKSARTQAEEAIASERKARVELLVNEAVQAGRLKPADKDAKVTELCNAQDDEFDGKIAELGNAKAQYKKPEQMQSRNLGDQQAADDDRSGQIRHLVNECMEQRNCDYTTAFVAMRKKHPVLFGDEAKIEE